MLIFQIFGAIILLCLIVVLLQSRGILGTSIFPQSITDSHWAAKVFMGFVGLVLLLLPQLFFYAEYGTNYYLVSPFGKEYVIMESRGIQWRGFARVTPWTKYIDIKTVEKKDGQIIEDVSELEGFIEVGIPIRFIDQVTGDTKLAARFQLPSTEKEFLVLAKKFRTLSNLVNNTLIPTLIEQTKNTGYMFSAQNYISGDAQQFKQTLEEQLKGGSFQVRKEELKDTIFNEISDTGSRGIREITTTYKVSKVTDYKTGLPIRIPHEITENGILVSQVIIQDVDLEPQFKERLEKQRDESAKRQLAQQETETAKAEQLKIIAQGENAKARERVAKEKEQITQVIAYETEKEIEKQKLEKAKIALETAEVEAKATRVTADAEAYKNQKLVSAGLTPQEKAKIDKEIAIGVAAELAKLQLPTYYIQGQGSSGQASLLESLLGVKLLEGK